MRSGVIQIIIKCSEHGGGIVDAPLRSHTLPDTTTQMWLFVSDCPPGFNRVKLTTIYKRHCNSLSQAILVTFLINSFLKLSFDYVLACHLVAILFFGPLPNLLADPCFKVILCTSI